MLRWRGRDDAFAVTPLMSQTHSMVHVRFFIVIRRHKSPVVIHKSMTHYSDTVYNKSLFNFSGSSTLRPYTFNIVLALIQCTYLPLTPHLLTYISYIGTIVLYYRVLYRYTVRFLLEIVDHDWSRTTPPSWASDWIRSETAPSRCESPRELRHCRVGEDLNKEAFSSVEL